MKISRQLSRKKANFVRSRVRRNPTIALNELQRRLVRYFGQTMGRNTLRNIVETERETQTVEVEFLG